MGEEEDDDDDYYTQTVVTVPGNQTPPASLGGAFAPHLKGALWDTSAVECESSDVSTFQKVQSKSGLR